MRSDWAVFLLEATAMALGSFQHEFDQDAQIAVANVRGDLTQGAATPVRDGATSPSNEADTARSAID